MSNFNFKATSTPNRESWGDLGRPGRPGAALRANLAAIVKGAYIRPVQFGSGSVPRPVLDHLQAIIALFFLFSAFNAHANENPTWPLATEVKVDSRGIFLRNVIAPAFTQPVPEVRLADAPAFGRLAILTRAQIADALARSAPELEPVWTGPERVRVVRRSRMLDETEMKQLLTSALQDELVRERGELELRFMRPWTPILAPDEAMQLRVLDLPTMGVTPNFIARCEVKAGTELVGNFQINVSAKVWREVWVARSALTRGQPVQGADIGTERRDVLSFKEGLSALPPDLSTYDFGENLPGGSILTPRSLKQRPIIKRGRTLDALVLDGSLQIVVKVEALEDGLPGQFVRVRNIKSRREFRGKVQDEQTVAVAL